MSAARIDYAPDYGEEVALRIEESGCEIRTNAGTVGDSLFGADYVRIVSPDGDEIGYWIHDEWQEDPIVVMGAILGAAAGNVVVPVDPEPGEHS